MLVVDYFLVCFSRINCWCRYWCAYHYALLWPSKLALVKTIHCISLVRWGGLAGSFRIGPITVFGRDRVTFRSRHQLREAAAFPRSVANEPAKFPLGDGVAILAYPLRTEQRVLVCENSGAPAQHVPVVGGRVRLGPARVSGCSHGCSVKTPSNIA